MERNGNFPFINLDECGINNTLFLDRYEQPMHFVVGLHKNHDLMHHLIAFIKYCGGIAVSDINKKTFHSAVIVFPEDINWHRPFTGDLFSAKYIQDCFKAKDLLDISKYRLNDMPSPLEDDFDYMKIIFYKTWSWLDIPKQFWKEKTVFMSSDEESETGSPQKHIIAILNSCDSLNNKQKHDKKKVRFSSDDTLSLPLSQKQTHGYSASSYQPLPQHSTPVASNNAHKRKGKIVYESTDDKLKTVSPLLPMKATPNLLYTASNSHFNNDAHDKKKVRFSSDDTFSLPLSQKQTHGYSASSYQPLSQHSTPVASNNAHKRKGKIVYESTDDKLKTVSPLLPMKATPNLLYTASNSHFNNDAQNKKRDCKINKIRSATSSPKWRNTVSPSTSDSSCCSSNNNHQKENKKRDCKINKIRSATSSPKWRNTVSPSTSDSSCCSSNNNHQKENKKRDCKINKIRSATSSPKWRNTVSPSTSDSSCCSSNNNHQKENKKRDCKINKIRSATSSPKWRNTVSPSTSDSSCCSSNNNHQKENKKRDCKINKIRSATSSPKWRNTVSPSTSDSSCCSSNNNHQKEKEKPVCKSNDRSKKNSPRMHVKASPNNCASSCSASNNNQKRKEETAFMSSDEESETGSPQKHIKAIFNSCESFDNKQNQNKKRDCKINKIRSATSSPKWRNTVSPSTSDSSCCSSNNNHQKEKEKPVCKSNDRSKKNSPRMHVKASPNNCASSCSASNNNQKRKEETAFMSSDEESETGSPQKHIKAIFNSCESFDNKQNQNKKRDCKINKIRSATSSPKWRNTVSPSTSDSSCCSSNNNHQKEKEKPVCKSNDRSKKNSPRMHVKASPNNCASSCSASNNNQKRKKNASSESDDELSVTRTPSLFAALLKLQRKKQSKASYVNKEKEAILRYILKHRAFDRVHGVELWKEMERRNVCKIRTWQSMKEHFRKQLLPNIRSFIFLSKKDIESFKLYCHSK